MAHVDKMKLCLSEGQDLSREDARTDIREPRKDALVSAYDVPAAATSEEDASVNWGKMKLETGLADRRECRRAMKTDHRVTHGSKPSFETDEIFSLGHIIRNT